MAGRRTSQGICLYSETSEMYTDQGENANPAFVTLESLVKLSKPSHNRMEIHDVPCTVAALIEEERIVESPAGIDQEKSIQISARRNENIINIQAALSRSDLKRCYIAEAQRAVFPQEEKRTIAAGR